MQNNANTNVEHIIAKIDNDFNPDNSDWIPRVAAWVIDAMSQLKALRTVRTKKKLIVKDGIAYSSCPIDSPNLIVYDNNGCKITKAKGSDFIPDYSSTGKITHTARLTPKTVDIIHNSDPNHGPNIIANTINDRDLPERYNYVEVNSNGASCDRNYTIVDNNKLEINFDADCIYVETDTVKTQYSTIYNCELPVIPNNGLLIEGITNWCMYKMLTRGYKHPVFNLAASQYGTNPYYMFKSSKSEIRTSLILDAQGEVIDDGGLWQAGFYINTFNPRR